MLQQKPLLGELPDWTRFPKPVALWPFIKAGNLIDLSGNRHTGTFGAGAASPSWTAGNYGSAVIFDGGDYIDCGLASNILTAHPSTRIVWFRRTAEDRTFLLSGTSPNHDLQIWNDDTIYFEGSGDQYKFSHTYDAKQHCIAIVDAGSGNSGYAAYLDGVLQSISSSGVASTSQNNFIIGNRDAADRGMIGLIDLVMIFPFALNASQIAYLYNINPFPWFAEDEVSHLYLPGGAPSGIPIIRRRREAC